ncbi:MAG: response regulator transcription factor [Gemmatimonadota bacterium]
MGIGPQPSVLVTVHQDGSPARAAKVKAALPADVAERFDLTPRQAEVAALLARRLTNREVGKQLRISHHTARHHAERVLAKLGIRSRRAVAAKLSGLGND